MKMMKIISNSKKIIGNYRWLICPKCHEKYVVTPNGTRHKCDEISNIECDKISNIEPLEIEKMNRIIEYHKLTEYDYNDFCYTLKKLNIQYLLMDLNAFGGSIFISSHSHKHKLDTISINISKMTKFKIIKMFIFMCKFKPSEVDEIDEMISFYWY